MSRSKKVMRPNPKYRFYSNTTGELHTNIFSALGATISDLFRFHILHTWSYRKGGF